MDEADDVASPSGTWQPPSLVSPLASSATGSLLTPSPRHDSHPNIASLPALERKHNVTSFTDNNLIQVTQKLSQLALDSSPAPKAATSTGLLFLPPDLPPPTSAPWTDYQDDLAPLQNDPRLSIQLEIPRLKTELEAEKHLREEAEKQARRWTVQELRCFIDKLLLEELRLRMCVGSTPLPMAQRTLLQIQSNSRSTASPGAKKTQQKISQETSQKPPKNKSIPDELCYHHTMQASIAELGKILDTSLVQTRLTRVEETELENTSHWFVCAHQRLEDPLVTCWTGFVLSLVETIMIQLDDLFSEGSAAKATKLNQDPKANRDAGQDDDHDYKHDEDEQQQLIWIRKQLFSMYPCIWTKQVPSTLYPIEEEGALDLSSSVVPASRLPSSKASSNKQKANKKAQASSDTSSDKPPEEYGAIRSDFFSSYAKKGQVVLLHHVTELKAFNAHNSQVAESSFRPTMPAGSSKPVDHTTATIAVNSNFPGTQLYRDFDLSKAIRSGAMSADIRGHSCPFFHFNVGLTHVFFRYDHQLRRASFRDLEDAKSHRPPIKLHYYVVFKYPEPPSDQAEAKRDGDIGWRQKHPLVDAVLASLLSGLNERFATTEEQRIWWTKDIDQHAHLAIERTSHRPADVASPSGDPDPNPNPRAPEDDNHGHGGGFSQGGGGGAPGGARSGAAPGQRSNPAASRAIGQQGNHGTCKKDQAAGDASQRGAQDGARAGNSVNVGNGKHQAGRTRKVLGEIDTHVERPSRPLPKAIQAPPKQGPTGLKQQKQKQKWQRANIKHKLLACSGAKILSAAAAPAAIATDLAHAKVACSETNVAVHTVVEDNSDFEWDGTPRFEARYPKLVTRHWCTPECLAGLKYGHNMDATCPNVSLHCTIEGCTDHASHKHPYSLDHIRADMLEPIQKEGGTQRLFHMMEPIIGCEGACGQLFRFLHPKLGYAFAAKGMHAYYSQLLKKEHEMYQHLWEQLTTAERQVQTTGSFPILGHFQYGQASVAVHIPVTCGVVVPNKYFCSYPIYPGDPQFGGTLDQLYSSWLILSYHSLSLNRLESLSKLKKKLGITNHQEGATILQELKQWGRRKLTKLGIQHDDLHVGNMLWCNKLNAVVLIDFERADWL